MKSATPAIRVSALSFSVGGQKLLDDIHFQIDLGERIAIIGANGAGKTTLLRCLLGLLKPDSGEVSIHGDNIIHLTRSQIARNISYVPQMLNAEIPFTVQDFILMSRYAHTSLNGSLIPKDKEGIDIAQAMMKQAGIEHLAQRNLSTLSGGERQKASIAAALTQQSPILLLDEPAAHLDPKQQDSIRHLLDQVSQSENRTIITVTHDLNWAAADFDRILSMKKGHLIHDSKPTELITSENLAEIFDAHWEVHPHPQTGNPMVIR